MSKQKKPKPATQSGSQFLARHNLKGVLVPVTEEVRDLCARAAKAAGHRAASRWAAGVLEDAARKALAEPAPARPAALPEADLASLDAAAAALREQAAALERVRRRASR